MKPLKILFAGTPEFSVASLQTILAAGHEVVAVYTQPDRPAGRGRKLTKSAVKQFAESQKLTVHQPITLRDSSEQQKIQALQVDVTVVVAYGLILPKAILTMPRFGCVNVHASLLPRWRGAAPIQRAILAGDTETGITIMQMDAGLDTGPMLARATCPVVENETAQTLHDKLSILGGELLIKTLAHLSDCHPEKQDDTLATYAHKISREEARIDWQQSAIEIDRHIRAFNPWPVAFTQLQDESLRIWRAQIFSTQSTAKPPGTILQATKAGVDVATGEGILRLLTLQLSGGRVLAVSDLLNARHEFFAPNRVLQ